jgi:isoleucyl-tRNA synthetase
MSKSEGNDIKVEAALKEYGADVLRLWVASVDYQNDVPLGKTLLAKTGEAYRKIRNTIRYLLGNLYDFDPHKHATVPQPHSVDAWMQHRVAEWVESVQAAYERYEFHQVFRLLYEFCNVEISATYAKAIKDRLYCELPDSAKRRASQSVCFGTLLHLIELSAPILAFTAEEAWQAVRQLPGCAEFNPSIHLCTLTKPARDSAPNLGHWQLLMPLVERGNKQLDDLKRTIGLGNALDAEAVIIVPSVSDDVTQLINEYGPELEDALGVGHHRIEHGEVWDIKINDVRNLYPSCARSWKRRPDVGSDKEFPDLSARDAKVVRALRERK